MLFSIVVLSYNRPEQIERIISRLIPATCHDFDLIIKDDCSPRQDEIEHIICSLSSQCAFNITFYKNKVNLGYDRNLLDAFNVSTSDYVFFLSDDDFVQGEYIEKLYSILSRKEHSVYFTPYICRGRLYRKSLQPYRLKTFSDIIYSSVFFSGLVFDRKAVLRLPKDIKFLSNCIYTQVFLACVIIFNEKSFGMTIENLLYLGGDGINYFGKNQSAINKEDLEDRSSIISNFRYQKLLLMVVAKIASVTDPLFEYQFKDQYHQRLVAYLLRARALGIVSFKLLTNEIKETIKPLPWYISFSIYILPSLPARLAKAFYQSGIFLLRKSG